jgi:3-phosphoshikimate 1-carboxyvinyltransferase
MSLPDLIEIVPLTAPVRAEITVPGSKSITNRALVLAALAEGEVALKGALWSEDTQVMVECLQELGFMVNVADDPDEACNRTITVYGRGGEVPRGGTEAQPLELFVGNAGTAARFLAAMVCLGSGVYRLHGVPRMHERPQKALFDALRQLGYRVETPNDRLPAMIHACSSRRESAQTSSSDPSQSRLTSAATGGRRCRVSIAESSQFASALLLSARTGGWEVEIEGENADESPYVEMTKELIKVFPHRGGEFQIEPDASSGSYFVAVDTFVHNPEFLEHSEQFGVKVPTRLANPVKVAHWPDSGWQVDENFRIALANNWSLVMGLEYESQGSRAEELKRNHRKFLVDRNDKPISRIRDLGDSIMTAVILAPFAADPVVFTDLGRLRVQECERVVALRTELTKCGAKVIEEGDTLTVYPSQLHGAEIETYNDHRMAMCFAVLGLKVPGIKIKNPACVKKTFPNFFQKLATPPPRGLGVEIRDGHTGRRLTMEELFAE